LAIANKTSDRPTLGADEIIFPLCELIGILLTTSFMSKANNNIDATMIIDFLIVGSYNTFTCNCCSDQPYTALEYS